MNLEGRFGENVVRSDDSDLGLVEEYLCPLAKRFKDTHPGRKMEVGIVGCVGDDDQRTEVLKIVNGGDFMPALKEEARFVVPGLKETYM